MITLCPDIEVPVCQLDTAVPLLRPHKCPPSSLAISHLWSKLVEIQLVQTLNGSANVVHHVVDTDSQRPVRCSGKMNQQTGTLGGQLMAQLVGLERLVLRYCGADNLSLSVIGERNLHVTVLVRVQSECCGFPHILLLTVCICLAWLILV